MNTTNGTQLRPCCSRDRCCKCKQRAWAIYLVLPHYVCGDCRGKK